eukprot:11844438-Heterocapsa_arctica.AAC.1
MQRGMLCGRQPMCRCQQQPDATLRPRCWNQVVVAVRSVPAGRSHSVIWWEREDSVTPVEAHAMAEFSE